MASLMVKFAILVSGIGGDVVDDARGLEIVLRLRTKRLHQAVEGRDREQRDRAV